MKYGAVVYTNTGNMGDDIQAYAASRFYPHIDYYIEREKIDSFFSNDGEQVAAIMAGWYTHSLLNWPPSPFIKPLMVSMHFTPYMDCKFGDKNINILSYRASLDWFDKSGDAGVGCRDEHSVIMLEKLGIKAWWSGCITLTLKKFPDVTEHNKIVCIDLTDEQTDAIKRHTSKEIVKMTHVYTDLRCVDDRMKDVEERLKFYQGSSLVVTTRLHAALPAIALGVPVLYVINKNTDESRFGSYLKYLNCIDENDLLRDNIPYDLDCIETERTEPLRKMGERLSDYCTEFICSCEKTKNIPKLDLNLFIDSVSRMEELKSIIYMETRNTYIKEWSQKTEEPSYLFKCAMDELEKSELNRAMIDFEKAYKLSGGKTKEEQMKILGMYIRCLVQFGDMDSARMVLESGKEAYFDTNEYRKLCIELG